MFYFELGIRHITDWQGYDHMLFLLALTLPLSFRDWKVTLKWITAFTLGHSIALGLTATELIHVPGIWVELGIAVTIFITALLHLLHSFHIGKLTTLVSGVFGLVHGMGFGSYYSFIAQSDSFWWAWIPFNLGIEAGQIIVVLVLLFVYWCFQKFGGTARPYRWVLAGAVLAMSAQMILERLPQ